MDINLLLTFLDVIILFFAISIPYEERFLIVLLNLMNGIGIFYYVAGGNLYIPPSYESITYLLYINIVINLSYIMFILFDKIIFRKLDIIRPRDDKVVFVNNYKYVFVFFILPFFYFLVFYNKFPIYYMLLGEVIGESARPDVSGSLPHFYAFSVFLSSFTLPYLIQYYVLSNNRILKILVFLFLSFFGLLMGDKSTFMVIIFYIFLIKQGVSIKKVILFAIFFILFYILMKYLYYGELRYDTMDALWESIFRRVSLIGPSSFGMYVDYFVIQNGDIPQGFSHIKQFLFYLIYHYTPGGLSVIFPGSFIDKIKLGFIQIVFIGMVFFMILFIRKLLKSIKIYYFKDALGYLHFYGAILVAQGFISDLIIRYVIPALIFVLVDKIIVVFVKRYKKV